MGHRTALPALRYAKGKGRWSSVRQFGQLEAVVMERLWSYGRPVPVREVLEDLQRDRRIAYTTVMTVMDNLHRKGFLTREMAGLAYRYQTAQTREQHHATVMGEVLAGSSDRTATLLHFLEQMPPEEVVRLREALKAGPPSRKAAHS
jgi:predicted transcriptional regulator